MKLTAVKSGHVQSLPLVALSTSQASNDFFTWWLHRPSKKLVVVFLLHDIHVRDIYLSSLNKNNLKAVKLPFVGKYIIKSNKPFVAICPFIDSLSPCHSEVQRTHAAGLSLLGTWYPIRFRTPLEPRTTPEIADKPSVTTTELLLDGLHPWRAFETL